ncbi:MAG: type II 3-dehydroquinate dehydratase [Candidatus Dormibacteraceae bacterium]
MSRLVVVHGPNFNLLGTREPEIYGHQTLADLEALLRKKASELNCQLDFFQSNSEGALLDYLHERSPGATGLVINPGAFAYSSYALYDCLLALPTPAIEVHISNIYTRAEEFRSRSLLAAATVGVITGLGRRGYIYAMEYLIDRE